MHAQRERQERDSVQAWNEAMKDIREVLQEDVAVQECIVIIV